jgi:hypothetical protein
MPGRHGTRARPELDGTVMSRGDARRAAWLLPEAEAAEDDLDGWLDCEDISDGVPFLISPGLECDVDLNRYFLRPAVTTI